MSLVLVYIILLSVIPAIARGMNCWRSWVAVHRANPNSVIQRYIMTCCIDSSIRFKPRGSQHHASFYTDAFMELSVILT